MMIDLNRMTLGAGLAGIALLASVARPAVADQGAVDTLRAECAIQLNLGAGGCNCIAETAASELSDAQQALVAAMVSQDQATAATVRSAMSVQEISEAAMFMVNTPKRCAAQ